MKLGTLVSRSAMVAASLALFAGTARADGILGATLYKTGDMHVAFVGSDARYNDDLWFFLTVGSFEDAQFLFNNQSAVPGTDIDIDDSSLNLGDEAIFGLCVNTASASNGTNCDAADDIFYSGDAARNSDGMPHAKVWTKDEYLAEFGANSLDALNGDYQYVIGFEDILGGGDEDYNDAIFALQGVTAVPEPVTMTLLATGLAGMGGAGLVRRRKKNV